MTPEQVERLAPSAFTFAEAVIAEKKGAACINFQGGMVLFFSHSSPNAEKLQVAINAYFTLLGDATFIGNTGES